MLNKLLFMLAVTLVVSCSKVPVSNRKQVNLLPESEMMAMALTEYKTFLAENPPVTTTDPNSAMVKRVGQNIQAGVVQFLKEKKLSDRIKGYKWEFNLVNDSQVNAWCMPGGKVVVYTGLLKVTQNETALAVVMGHEIAHAVARHGNERMSQQLMAQAGGQALDVVLANKSPATRAAFQTAYGVGAQYGALLPYSRLQETEADKLGLVFCAIAGYDPQEAPAFWERMSKASGGGAPPEIMSTHPSDQTRISEIKKFMPEALKYYKKK